jgi:hypothetical protein
MTMRSKASTQEVSFANGDHVSHKDHGGGVVVGTYGVKLAVDPMK